jgi:hypothetical protein
MVDEKLKKAAIKEGEFAKCIVGLALGHMLDQ